MTLTDHLIYALLWLSFGLGHSALASQAAKRALHRLGRYYRLTFNLIAAGHASLIWAIGRFVLTPGLAPWPLPVWGEIALLAMAVCGGAILVLAMRSYDGQLFLGICQVRNREASDETEPLATGGLNRYMRHPLYSGAILLLFGLANDALGLMTAVWASTYFVIGAYFEERRLIARYGDAYRAYRERVPMFVPFPGRHAR